MRCMRRIGIALIVAGLLAFLVLLAGEAVTLPTALIIGAAVVFATAALVVLVAGFVASRREGKSVLRSLRSGVGAAGKWLFLGP